MKKVIANFPEAKYVAYLAIWHRRSHQKELFKYAMALDQSKPFSSDTVEKLRRSGFSRLAKMAQHHLDEPYSWAPFRIAEQARPFIEQAELKCLPKIRIVKQLPPPLDAATNWELYTADGVDSQKYKIKPAIYINESQQFPVFCEFGLIHEMVHQAIYQSAPKRFERIRWFDEGIADWLALRMYSKISKEKAKPQFIKRLYILYSDILPNSTLAEYDNYLRAVNFLARERGASWVQNVLMNYVQGVSREELNSIYADLLQRGVVKPLLVNKKELVVLRKVCENGSKTRFLHKFETALESLARRGLIFLGKKPWSERSVAEMLEMGAISAFSSPRKTGEYPPV